MQPIAVLEDATYQTAATRSLFLQHRIACAVQFHFLKVQVHFYRLSSVNCRSKMFSIEVLRPSYPNDRASFFFQFCEPAAFKQFVFLARSKVCSLPVNTPRNCFTDSLISSAKNHFLTWLGADSCLAIDFRISASSLRKIRIVVNNFVFIVVHNAPPLPRLVWLSTL